MQRNRDVIKPKKVQKKYRDVFAVLERVIEAAVAGSAAVRLPRAEGRFSGGTRKAEAVGG
jgi:hypothetical protein